VSLKVILLLQAFSSAIFHTCSVSRGPFASEELLVIIIVKVIYVLSAQLHAHTHTTILQPSWILSGTTRVSQHQKGKTNLDLLEQEIVSGNGISWAIC